MRGPLEVRPGTPSIPQALEPRVGGRSSDQRRAGGGEGMRVPARTAHQSPAAAADAPHPAMFSPLGVLDVPSSTPPRPSGRKPHWARHLGTLATNTGEKCGLETVRDAPKPPSPQALGGRGILHLASCIRAGGGFYAISRLWVTISIRVVEPRVNSERLARLTLSILSPSTKVPLVAPRSTSVASSPRNSSMA